MYIKQLFLPHGLWLGPMAGYTDTTMRRLCRRFGADITVTEMVSAKAVCYGDKKTHFLTRIYPDEAPCALQLFGSDPATLAEAAKIVVSGEAGYAKPAVIDINMGCPMPKITGNGEGGALLKNPALIYKIVSAVVGAVSVPVSVKLRIGWDEESINAEETAKAAEAGGAAVVVLHGRTVKQVYSGEADWSVIARTKELLSIPLVGNGDITSGADALSRINMSGVDGIMVGRAAVGNPFIFDEIVSVLEKRDYTPPTLAQKVEVALLQLKQACEDKGEARAIPEARKQVAAYVAGYTGAAEVRRQVNMAQSYLEVQAILEAYVSSLSE